MVWRGSQVWGRISHFSINWLPYKLVPLLQNRQKRQKFPGVHEAELFSCNSIQTITIIVIIPGIYVSTNFLDNLAIFKKLTIYWQRHDVHYLRLVNLTGWCYLSTCCRPLQRIVECRDNYRWQFSSLRLSVIWVNYKWLRLYHRPQVSLIYVITYNLLLLAGMCRTRLLLQHVWLLNGCIRSQKIRKFTWHCFCQHRCWEIVEEYCIK